MTLIQSGELTLEGLYHRGDRSPPLVICAPHPLYGGSMDAPVVAEIAWAVTRAGHPTLRFNYRGVGASPGAYSGGPGEQADVEAAIAHLEATAAHQRVALCGYSFGAGVALAVAARRGDVSHVILVAPPSGMIDLSLVARTEAAVFAVAGQLDTLVDGDAVRAALEPLGDRARFERILGADHVFTRGLGDLGKAVVRLLAEY